MKNIFKHVLTNLEMVNWKYAETMLHLFYVTQTVLLKFNMHIYVHILHMFMIFPEKSYNNAMMYHLLFFDYVKANMSEYTISNTGYHIKECASHVYRVVCDWIH